MQKDGFGSETKYFYELTPEKILSAVEDIGLRCTGRCLALNSLENRVYEVEVETEQLDLPLRAPQRYRVVKFYRPGRWSEEQIREEHRFLLDLREAELPVVTPLLFENGDTLLSLPELGIFCSVFEKAAGRLPDELNGEELRRLGRLLARVHMVGAQKSAPHRLQLNSKTYGEANLRYLIDNNIVPPEIASTYKHMVETVCGVAEQWFERFPAQRIHGDLHMGNILWGSQGPFLVDFDDMLTGPVVQDVWLMAGGRDELGKQNLDHLLSGYEELRHFDREQLVLIEPLRALRMVHFTAWIAHRWNDPAFQRTFPQFNAMQYWKDQISDLQDQIILIQGGEIC